MKRFLAIVAALAVSVSAFADEGMWLLPLLNQMNKKDLKAAGCKLSPEEMMNITYIRYVCIHLGYKDNTKI